MQKLSGLERSALLMLGLGEQHAAEILRHMGPKEVQEIGLAMAGLTHVTNSQMELVMQKFVDTIGEQTSLGMGSDEYIRNMLTSALGADKASGIIDRILLGRNSKGLEQLKWMDPRAIAELIRLEHPQIIAIVLSFLDPDQAAGVLCGVSRAGAHRRHHAGGHTGRYSAGGAAGTRRDPRKTVLRRATTSSRPRWAA